MVEFDGLTTDPVSAGGVGLAGLPSYNQSSPRRDDFIFVPGIQMENISVAQDIRPEFLSWLCDMDKKQVNICSVYTATFILAEAEILDHKECTTHWLGINILQKRYPKLKVIEGVLYVKSGNIYTSAGISSGIDMALAIIETLAGPKLAHIIVSGLVMYQRRSAMHLQKSDYLDFRNHINPKITRSRTS